jgi:hypothetical protein
MPEVTIFGEKFAIGGSRFRLTKEAPFQALKAGECDGTRVA